MALPFVIFWILVFIAKGELGLRWSGILAVIWFALLAGFMFLEISPYIFVAVQVVMDIILILVIFGGDIPIR